VEVARAIYTSLGIALLPFLPLRLWWRGKKEPGYRFAIGERFGRYTGPAIDVPLLWVHAVSVGETRAALPLIEQLKSAYPRAKILLTHMTAAGRETGRTLFGDGVTQAWLPYDLPFAVRGFLAHFRPVAGFLLETELWPNLLNEFRLGWSRSERDFIVQDTGFNAAAIFTNAAGQPLAGVVDAAVVPVPPPPSVAKAPPTRIFPSVCIANALTAPSAPGSNPSSEVAIGPTPVTVSVVTVSVAGGGAARTDEGELTHAAAVLPLHAPGESQRLIQIERGGAGLRGVNGRLHFAMVRLEGGSGCSQRVGTHQHHAVTRGKRLQILSRADAGDIHEGAISGTRRHPG
jgi:hypothetical protein